LVDDGSLAAEQRHRRDANAPAPVLETFMAYNNPNPRRMAANYMEDEPDDQQDRLAGEPKGNEGDEGEGPTAMLPKSILMGKDAQPGDEIVLKITKIFEDEFAVQYAHGEDEEGEEGDMGEGVPDAMME